MSLTNAVPSGASPAAKIGLIVCSQRKPRAGLQIGTFVLSSLQQHSPTASHKPYTLHLIDLADHPLPLFDEPGVPSQIHNRAEYEHEHTRAWSAFISSFDAFIFVTPQYNWGYPASVKNAIDYLFNEWKGKPGMVVSYGGHGGGKASAQLQQVLHGLSMRVVEKSVGLTFPDRGFLVKAAKGQGLGLDAEKDDGVWAKERQEIGVAFEEFLTLLDA